jgi:tetratricopeptide (TPR) repeat protein
VPRRISTFLAESYVSSGIALLLAVGAFLAALAKLPKDGAPRTLTYIAAVVILIAAAIDVARKAARGTVKRRSALERLLIDYPLKRASSVKPSRIGIAKSELGDPDSTHSRYIDRDVDQTLIRALTAHRFVVLRGDAKAGKSRTALQAVRRLEGDPWLVALTRTASARELLEHKPWPKNGPIVVWLDKIDGFLRGGRFPMSAVTALESEDRITVVATIENGPWNDIQTVTADLDLPDGYEAADVLRRAHPVELGPTSAPERAAARRAYPGESFDLGIGQQFVAAQELRDRYTGGLDEHVAVVRAAVDWQRTGMPRSITRAELEALYEDYLQSEPGDYFAEALRWATTAVGSGGRLLEHQRRIGTHCYVAPDHIITWLGERNEAGEAWPHTDEIWERVLATATAEEALAIGARALEVRRLEDAAQGFTRAYESSDPASSVHKTAAIRLATVMRRAGRPDEAEEVYRQAIADGNLMAANNYGYMLVRAEKTEEALGVLTPAVAKGNRTAAFTLLDALAARGELEKADDLFGDVARGSNPAAALVLGLIHHGRGDLDGADELYRAAGHGTRRSDGTFTCRAMILRAFIQAERGEHAASRAAFRDAWDAREWQLIDERLDQTDLGRLRDIQRQLVSAL